MRKLLQGWPDLCSLSAIQAVVKENLKDSSLNRIPVKLGLKLSGFL